MVLVPRQQWSRFLQNDIFVLDSDLFLDLYRDLSVNRHVSEEEVRQEILRLKCSKAQTASQEARGPGVSATAAAPLKHVLGTVHSSAFPAQCEDGQREADTAQPLCSLAGSVLR